MSLIENGEKALNQIIDEMVDAVSHSKEEILHISEETRKEIENLEKELETLKRRVKEMIEEEKELEKKVKKERYRLSEVSKHFDKYSEEQVREVYERAHDMQTKLLVHREKEKEIRRRRDELEKRLKNLSRTIDRAERLLSKITTVLKYLTDDFQQVSDAIEDAKEKQAFGLKIIDAQEEERRRLSREIHDGPAQMLANVLLRSDLVERTFRQRGVEAAMKEVKEMRENVRSALYEVRRIIYDLRPMALDDLGLIPTMRKYLDTVEEYHEKRIEFRSFGQEKRLDSKYEVALFRLVQEAVQNAVKHADASLIQVKVELTYQRVTMVVKDNGKGFNPDEKKEGSFGLIGMKERVEMLDGDLSIDSAPGRGTKIEIKVPLKA
ncbi:MAG: sensor histidine kinase [Bacillaceae bacterium]|nr:sensor histidine kinase [Bacillaceae bacterium]